MQGLKMIAWLQCAPGSLECGNLVVRSILPMVGELGFELLALARWYPKWAAIPSNEVIRLSMAGDDFGSTDWRPV